MKTITIIVALLIAVLNGLVFVPALQPNAKYLIAGSLALSVWLALKGLMAKPPAVESAPEPIVVPQVPKVEKVLDEEWTKAQAIALLGAFQSKGRLIDFLMDDVTAYSDAQVGAAARVVQQGCRSALDDHFVIEPVSSEKEGSKITVPTDAAADAYRLVGNVAGEPPFSGTLVHKGWATRSVKLPRLAEVASGKLPVLAPAQVELK